MFSFASPLFGQQADKSELWGATPRFLPGQGATPWLDFVALQGIGYPQVSPSFRMIPRLVGGFHSVLRLLLPVTPVIAGFLSFKTGSVGGIPRFLSCGANRLDPRFFPLGVYCRCREFRTIGARTRAPGLELGSFSLVGTPRKMPHGSPAGVSPGRLPSRPPLLGRLQPLVHRGPMDSIQFSMNAWLVCPVRGRQSRDLHENHLKFLRWLEPRAHLEDLRHRCRG